MLKPGTHSPKKRVPLSRERVLQSAVAIADTAGIGSLTIRSLAQRLGVKPMSIYYYVPNKSAILDGIVDLVFSEIELPAVDGDWRAELVRRANSARQVLSRHHWAIGLMESRKSPGPATLRHHDAVLGTKIKSSMRSPRMLLALCSPSTQVSASTTLLLPQPLGPTMAVTPCSKVNSERSGKLLKPAISRRWSRM